MVAPPSGEITFKEIAALREWLEPLIGLRIDWLGIPERGLPGFEPSQVAVIVNTILDAALPQIELLASDPDNLVKLKEVGLKKAPRLIGEREAYPDYIHRSGYRLELKGLFVDNPALGLKRPPTRREASARVKDNITVTVVDPAKDVLMLAAAQLQNFDGTCHPVIIDIGLFSMIECLRARDARLVAGGGRWLNGKIPQVVKKKRRTKVLTGEPLMDGDFEKDTNFGKLKRIPYPPLQEFMKAHGYKTLKEGTSPLEDEED